MSQIKTMQQLRDRVIKAIDELDSGEIDLAKASAIAKLSETIVSGLRSEMQYSILTNKEPKIDFFGEGSGKSLVSNTFKKLL